jgi:DNA polymerase (family 10)
VSDVAEAGSLRRKQDTVGNLDFLVSGKSATAIFKRFAEYAGTPATEQSKTDASFRLSFGMSVRLAWTKTDTWGLALLLATGSAAHLEDLKQHASTRKLQLTAAALGRKRISTRDEPSVYSGLGLRLIEPELREGRGEVEAAASGELPTLITIEDLQGDLHMHTTASDGANSLAEMAAAAEERGYRYIAITDHSQSLKITNGLTEKRLFQQIRAIDKINAKLKRLVVLKSAEVDILEDGTLDYSNAALKELDLTICSIHSRFGLDKAQQTARIMRAMDNRYFNILGHATGRLLLKREGYGLEIEKILEHAKASGCYLEINSSPDRLDLSDEHAKMAKDVGIKLAVNTDAHSTRELDFISAGLNQARRGWLEPSDVLNAYPLAKLKKLLKR